MTFLIGGFASKLVGFISTAQIIQISQPVLTAVSLLPSSFSFSASADLLLPCDGDDDVGRHGRRALGLHQRRARLVPRLAALEALLRVEEGQKVRLALVPGQVAALLERRAAHQAFVRLQT